MRRQLFHDAFFVAKCSILDVLQDSDRTLTYPDTSFPRWALNRQCFWKKT